MKKGNKVLIWGACERNNDILIFFKEHSVNVVGYIDQNAHVQHTYNDLNVFSKEIIKNDAYFVFVGLINSYTDIITFFEDNNYKEYDDYWYPYRIVALDGSKNYKKDLYGNEYIGENYKMNIKLRNGGQLHIGKNCKFDTVYVTAYDMSKINIGKGVSANSNLYVNSLMNSTINMGDNCRWDNADINCFFSSTVNIGEMASACIDFCVVATQNSQVIIGRDCMLSRDIVIRAGNTHNIYDIETRKNLSEIGRSVVLGEHVWIGQRAVLFNGCDIGSGSIVGINSFVNKKFPANCSIAGNPARIIKQNIAWRREEYPYFDSYDDFGEFDYR